jgi:hypothetical protein
MVKEQLENVESLKFFLGILAFRYLAKREKVFSALLVVDEPS